MPERSAHDPAVPFWHAELWVRAAAVHVGKLQVDLDGAVPALAGPVLVAIVAGFFLTVAGIGMSFAGFAGLMNSLRRRGETWTPMDLYQLRIIVAYAIATLFGSLATIPFVFDGTPVQPAASTGHV